MNASALVIFSFSPHCDIHIVFFDLIYLGNIYFSYAKVETLDIITLHFRMNDIFLTAASKNKRRGTRRRMMMRRRMRRELRVERAEQEDKIERIHSRSAFSSIDLNLTATSKLNEDE